MSAFKKRELDLSGEEKTGKFRKKSHVVLTEETKEKEKNFLDCKVDENTRYFRMPNGLWESERNLDESVTRKWLSKHKVFAKRCKKLMGRGKVVEGKESKTPLNEVVIREGEEGTFNMENIEDCRPRKGKTPRKYLIKWEGYEEKTWEPENNVTPCFLMKWFHDHPSKVEKCEPGMSTDVYNAVKKKTEPSKIKVNDIFIRATQDAINKTFLPRGKKINMLILDGEDLNTTFRLLDGIKPPGIIDSIVIPNPASSNIMRQLFCSDERLVDTVELYNATSGEYLDSLGVKKKQFASVWLDFVGSFYKEEKHNPRNDIINLFEKQLLADGAIFAVTLFYGRGREDRWYEAVEQIPVYAKSFGYELESLCGLDYTYECRDPKLSSSFDYGPTMSFFIFKVHKPTKEGGEVEEEEEGEDEYDENYW